MIKAYVGNEYLSAETLKEMVNTMRANDIKPKKVKSVREAKRLNKYDPLFKGWVKGDKYYLLCTKDHRVPINLAVMGE